ncbi:hypothetical protein, partial [Streptomyces sp. NPDC055134]
VASSDISVGACKDAQDRPKIVMSVDALSGDASSRKVTARFGVVARSGFVANSVTAPRSPNS